MSAVALKAHNPINLSNSYAIRHRNCALQNVNASDEGGEYCCEFLFIDRIYR